MKDYIVKRSGRFLKNCIINYKTTAVGVAAITVGIRALITDPVAFLSNETALMAFLVGLGMLVAADQNTQGDK